MRAVINGAPEGVCESAGDAGEGDGVAVGVSARCPRHLLNVLLLQLVMLNGATSVILHHLPEEGDGSSLNQIQYKNLS